MPVDKDETRSRLLQAATTVFAEKGYFRATMDDVVARAGSSKGALYFHFASKEALFLALMDTLAARVWEAVEEALAKEHGAERKISAAIRAVLRCFEEEQALVRISLLEAPVAGGEAAAHQHRLRLGLTAVITAHVEELVAEGRVPPQRAEVAAIAFFGTLYEAVYRWLVEGQPSLQEVADDLIRYNLRGMGLFSHGGTR